MGVFLRTNRYFLIPTALFVLIGIVFLSLYSKEEIHLTQNSWYHPVADVLFDWGTYLGDGWMFLVAAIGACWSRLRLLVSIALCALLTLLFVGFAKNVVFTDNSRPVKYFEEIAELRRVEGVEPHKSNSFPSGHTTAAFALYGLLSFALARRKAVQFSLFGIALFVGYSRIYLSQHFFEDVVAGAFLGSCIAALSWWFYHRAPYAWLDLRLIKR